MRDPRQRELAQLLIDYSVKLQEGEKLYIEVRGIETLSLAKELVRAATKRGGVPFWYFNDDELSRCFINNASEAQFSAWGDFHREIMASSDAYIALRGNTNAFDLADISPEQTKWYNAAYWDKVHSLRVKEKKWCVLRYPNPSMAIMAQKPTEVMEDFYYKVCTMDYPAMSKAMDPLVVRLKAADQVKIKGPGTELSFSIKGIGAVKCDGERNIPDGEVYTCPVRDSMNGVITYNTGSLFRGNLYKDVRFVVKHGKIQEATCSGDNVKLNQILDQDDGARHFGEFAFGVNPHITAPMMDTLFDEKIAGSFHLTPGQAYDATDNGNKSAVHWDLVSIQTKAHGGGEIYLDGELIRKDGLFVPEDLLGLNPDRLG
jgi:aminopeptidase